MMRDLDPEAATEGLPTIYRNLMTVCLLGTTRGLLADAEVVADAVHLTVNNPRPFQICRAIAHGLAGDAAFAQRLLAEDDGDDACRVALATALLMAGDGSWRGVIDSVLARSHDGATRQAANSVIGFAGTLH
jgi:hypothetical protein